MLVCFIKLTSGFILMVDEQKAMQTISFMQIRNWCHLTCCSSFSHLYTQVVEVHCTCIEDLNTLKKSLVKTMLKVSSPLKYKHSLPINKVYGLCFQLFCTVQICKDKGISNIFYSEVTTQCFFAHDLQPFQCILPKRKIESLGINSNNKFSNISHL